MFQRNPFFPRDDFIFRLSNDPRSRLYMPPETIVPATWNVDPDFVRSDFKAIFHEGLDLTSPIPIAVENSIYVFLSDDGFRYLFWFVVNDKLAEIIYPYKLGNFMVTFTFHDQDLKLRWLKDPLQQ